MLIMNAEWRFNVVLDQISGSDPKLTDSILETPARSPSCLREIFEQTLIEPAGNTEAKSVLVSCPSPDVLRFLQQLRKWPGISAEPNSI
jgi:hypothetical protein